MEDNQKHVTDTRTTNIKGSKTAYCGELIGGQFAFEDAEHLLNTIKSGGRLRACPKCQTSIENLLML